MKGREEWASEHEADELVLGRQLACPPLEVAKRHKPGRQYGKPKNYRDCNVRKGHAFHRHLTFTPTGARAR